MSLSIPPLNLLMGALNNLIRYHFVVTSRQKRFYEGKLTNMNA